MQAYEQGLRFSAAGRHLEAIGCFEQALAAKPDDARVLFALGNTARDLGLAAAAENFFARVLAQEPGRLEALVNLGNLLRSEGRFGEAIALLAPALAHAPDSAELALTLGSAWRETGDHEKAAHFYRAALAARPGYAPALANLADLLADDGDAAGALDLYGRAIKSAPGNAQARLNRAVLHLLTGNLKDGWRDYAARLDIPGKVPVADRAFTAWDGGPLKGARLLVRCEQGVGDQILFASLIPDLAARMDGPVTLECEPRLVPLFARSFPGVDVRPAVLKTVNGRVTADYGWLKGGAKAAVPMGTLPRHLRRALGDFPAPHAYLVPDAQERARWRAAFPGEGPFIGICWRSGKTGGHRAAQYAPLEAWGAFLRDMPGTPVVAQYDATDDEIAALKQISGRTIIVPQGIDQKNALDRTAAMLSALDALISAPTAVSWLGAATGTPTFKLLYDTSWTALGQPFEPFAPACRLIAPAMRGDWTDVFRQTRAALAAL